MNDSLEAKQKPPNIRRVHCVHQLIVAILSLFFRMMMIIGDGMDGQDGVDNGQRLQQQQQRFASGRERTRSESGKENAAINPRRPAIMTSRHRRERTGETAMAARLAVVATLSSRDDVDDCTLPFRRQSTESPIEEFLSTDSAVPSDSDHGTTWNDRDHHSSEEELECINGYEVDCDRHRREESVDNDATPLVAAAASGTALRFGPSAFGPPRFGLDHGQQSAPHRTPVSISSQVYFHFLSLFFNYSDGI